ncbi:MAG TPA: hypothetical protein VJ851_02230 [Jatrophihabitans sp.]|nr:hypothetical protein [Jatrophihabitans sp.]
MSAVSHAIEPPFCDQRRPVLTWSRRLVQLYLGLVLYGISAAMMVRARLGLDPWDVFHQGIAERTGHAMGTVSVVVGALVLLLWIPLPQRPGLGTVSNVVVLGLAMNQALRLLPAQHVMPAQLGVLVGGIVLCGIATGMYISAGLGPGPRDGLMTGYAARTGLSIRLTRTLLELTVLTVGWLLGGSVGLGTVLFAVGIGPLSQLSLGLLAIPGVPINRRSVPD